MPKDMFFQAISLLSQYLADLEPILHKTSCLDPESREMIGILEAIQVFLDPKDKEDAELIDFFKQLQNFYEKLGLAKWQRTELTDLGLRIGQRHKESITTGYDVNEIDIYQEAKEE